MEFFLHIISNIDLISFSIFLIIFFVISFFIYIQKSNKLDFADMITKNGKSVSLTKVIQLVGAITATWVIIKLTLGASLTLELFIAYLTYVGSVEAYSKYIAAKFNYDEKSIKENKE